MKRTPSLVWLEKKLASDPCAILDTSDIRLLDREGCRVLTASFPDVETYLDRSQHTIRWHALAARCAEAVAHEKFARFSVALRIPHADCEPSSAGTSESFGRISRVATSISWASRHGSRAGAVQTGNSRAEPGSWMTLHSDGI